MLLSKEVRELQSYDETNTNELYHYGVLGMRWGVRRGRTSQVTAKAQKKLAKLDNKVDKYQRKAYKHANPIIRTSISDGLYKGATRKRDKYTARAIKWYKKSKKVLGEQTVNQFVNSDGVKIGMRYAEMLRDRKI